MGASVFAECGQRALRLLGRTERLNQETEICHAALTKLKQGDITKAVKGVVNAGLAVQRVVTEGGKIIIFTAQDNLSPPPGEWDDVQ